MSREMKENKKNQQVKFKKFKFKFNDSYPTF